jgi:hypothetical protein
MHYKGCERRWHNRTWYTLLKRTSTLPLKLSDFTVRRHTWRISLANCAVLTGNNAGLRTVLSSRLSHRGRRSSLRESQSFLSLPVNTTISLFLSTRTRRRRELTKKLTNLMGNLCCSRELSVQLFVQIFTQLNLECLETVRRLQSIQALRWSRYEPGNSQTDESEMLQTRPWSRVTECRQRLEFTHVVGTVLGSSLKLSKTETSRWLSRFPAAVSVSHKVGTLETATQI